MEIDFYQDYKNLPVPELVKVARSPWDYLPEAVAAADRVLRERGISMEEIAAEEWNLAQKEMSDALARRRFGDYFDWVKELLPSTVGEGPATRPWIFIFLLGYAIFYVCNIYLIIKTTVIFARCETCHDTGYIEFADFLEFAYLTVTLLLLLKQKPLGWALVLIQAVSISCTKLVALYGLYAHHADLSPFGTADILPLLISAAVIIFLWRPFALEFFNVRKKYGNIALLVAILIMLLQAFLGAMAS